MRNENVEDNKSISAQDTVNEDKEQGKHKFQSSQIRETWRFLNMLTMIRR